MSLVVDIKWRWEEVSRMRQRVSDTTNSRRQFILIVYFFFHSSIYILEASNYGGQGGNVILSELTAKDVSEKEKRTISTIPSQKQQIRTI
jgi:hypothetical protein